MQISELDKKAIDAAVEELHYISQDAAGGKYIELYADYRDTNEGLLEPAYDNRRMAFETKDDPQYVLSDHLRETIYDWYRDEIAQKEDEVLRKAGIEWGDESYDVCMEYLRDTYPFIPDYDHFLKQDMRVNIMLKCGDEGNRDFIGIYEQHQALVAADWTPEDREAALTEETGLTWLVKQQGHTMEELRRTLDEYIDFFTADENKDLKYDQKYSQFRTAHNPFLTSLCQELENMPNYMNTMTALTSMSLTDFAEYMQPGKEIVLPKDSMVGIFNPWNGGGSTLDIELEKDLVIPSDMLYDIQIEGAKPNQGYTVDSVYGLVVNAWKSAAQVRDVTESKSGPAPTLSSLIQSASQRAGAAAEQHAPAKGISSPEQGRS